MQQAGSGQAQTSHGDISSESSSTSRAATTVSIHHTLDIGSTGQNNFTATSKRATTIRAAAPGPPFGAVLAEIFHVLSVMSTSDDILRLDAISDIHTFPILGYGMSFVARLVPQSKLGGALPTGHQTASQVVYKSLRHVERPEERGNRARKLQEILRELRITTHEPLRRQENIVRIIGIGWETNRLPDNDTWTSIFHWPFLVQEHAPYGTLADFLEQVPVNSEGRTPLCLDVGRGLRALHQSDVVHGDVKLENMLVFPHPRRKYVVKLADFGSALLDLDARSPATTLLSKTVPWNAPECDERILWPHLKLTDVYSFGFLVWRTMAYGHLPFTGERGGVHSEVMDTITQAKMNDLLPVVAESYLQACIRDRHLVLRLTEVLKSSLIQDPRMRSLDRCLGALGSSGLTPDAQSVPIQSVGITMEQGLGVYAYGGAENQRLHYQYLHSLESHCIYAQGLDHDKLDEGSDELLCHAPATLVSHYIAQHVSGQAVDHVHKLSNLNLAMLWLSVSAGSKSTASAEALLPFMEAFSAPDVGTNDGMLWEIAATALFLGSEFILRDVMEADVPGKQKFLESFTTWMNRGAGFRLSIPKDVFERPFSRFPEFLGQPYYLALGQATSTPSGVIDASYLMRIAAGWGSLEAVQLLVKSAGAKVNSQDHHGETALLKACRAGHVVLVEWLVNKGRASAQIGSKKNVTPLHWLNSFPHERVRDLAALLASAGGRPNVVMKEEFGGAEGQYWFFKGPPLMRVVASNNLPAVEALLAIGADPLVERIHNGETPLIFAARRCMVDILKALVGKIKKRSFIKTEARIVQDTKLLRQVLACDAAYSAKIHKKGYEKAQMDTFDYIWFLEKNPITRQFQAVRSDGSIPIDVAVKEGNLPFVKRILEDCPQQWHIRTLVATIGLQTAIVGGRSAIFSYLLSEGAEPLHPVLAPPQYKTYLEDGPWLPSLASHQKKTNSLHLCAEAGMMAGFMANEMLVKLLPASQWDQAPSKMRNQDHIDCCCVRPPRDHPIVDSRNEQDETPFFCALKAEEYELAYVLHEAGANKNVLVADPHKREHTGLRDGWGMPLVEHVLDWVSAYKALHFLIKDCWGCLRVTGYQGKELREKVIEVTANWPLEEASKMVRYVQERAYPGRKWDREVLKAVKYLNVAAVEILVRDKALIPSHSNPRMLYEQLRTAWAQRLQMASIPKVVSEMEKIRMRFERRNVARAGTSILTILRENYPNFPPETAMERDLVSRLESLNLV